MGACRELNVNGRSISSRLSRSENTLGTSYAHNGYASLADLRVIGYVARFALILGLGSALILQFLALILLWAGRNSLPQKARIGPPNRTYGPPLQAEQPPPAQD
jgi:hypothetical protein